MLLKFIIFFLIHQSLILQVSLQSLMGKYGSGKTYIKLKAKSGNILNAAAASLRRLEADISLKDYPISESIKTMVEDIERASPNYDWLFHKGSKKVGTHSLNAGLLP